MSEATKNEMPAEGLQLALDHIAEYVVQELIRQDVNAFPESTLLQELIAYKLGEVAEPLMQQTVRRAGRELVRSGRIDLKAVAGGLNTQKRILFRNADQYNSFVTLFFHAVEDGPELVEFIDDEASFENFMIYCVYEFKACLDEFVEGIISDRLGLEREQQLYVVRSKKAEALQDLPTYADLVAARIDGLAGAEAEQPPA